MDTIILGNGGLGRAIAAALVDRGEPVPRVLGRPAGGTHSRSELAGPEPAAVVFDAQTRAASRFSASMM